MIENCNSFIDYIQSGFQSVEGWATPQAFEALKLIRAFQLEHGISGGAAEIGVHHGRFFIGLDNCLNAGELSLAIDVFDNQADNIDYSGRGSYEKFLENISLHGRGKDSLRVMARDSMGLTIKDLYEIQQEHGSFRLFSIDGGHTAEHTVNDLRIAEQLSAASGVVFVDDYLNRHWPGVHEGVCRHYILSTPRFVPFAYCHDKLLLTSLTWHKRYLDYFVRYCAQGDNFKLVEIFGYKVAVM